MDSPKRFQTSKRYNVFSRIVLAAALIAVLGVARFYHGIYSTVLLISFAYAAYSYVDEVTEITIGGDELTLKSPLKTVKIPVSNVEKVRVVWSRAGNMILVYTKKRKFRVSPLQEQEELINILNRSIGKA